MRFYGIFIENVRDEKIFYFHKENGIRRELFTQENYVHFKEMAGKPRYT